MPILPLTKVVPDTDILADDHNDVIDAICDIGGGHDHTGAVDHGKPVDHAHLIDAGTHDHTGSGLLNTLDWHMDAAKGSVDHGLHGLIAGHYLPGVYVVAAPTIQPIMYLYRHQCVQAERYVAVISKEGITNNVLMGYLYQIVNPFINLLGIVATAHCRAASDLGWTRGCVVYDSGTFEVGLNIHEIATEGSHAGWWQAACSITVTAGNYGIWVPIGWNPQDDDHTFDGDTYGPIVTVQIWGY